MVNVGVDFCFLLLLLLLLLLLVVVVAVVGWVQFLEIYYHRWILTLRKTSKASRRLSCYARRSANERSSRRAGRVTWPRHMRRLLQRTCRRTGRRRVGGRRIRCFRGFRLRIDRRRADRIRRKSSCEWEKLDFRLD
jgi:hypothetical protein